MRYYFARFARISSADEVLLVALDEAMDTSDAVALGHLYNFSVDVSVFTIFVQALRSHIQVRHLPRLHNKLTVTCRTASARSFPIRPMMPR